MSKVLTIKLHSSTTDIGESRLPKPSGCGKSWLHTTIEMARE